MSRVREMLLRHYKKIVFILSITTLALAGLLLFQMDQLIHLKQQPLTHKQYIIKKRAIPVIGSEPELYMDIYPGDTIEKIANRLEEKDIIVADDFLSYLQKNEIYIKGNKYKKQDRRYILEGYFLPGTYGLFYGTSPQELCEIFIEPYLEWMKQKGNEQALIIASIIEKEAAIDDDRYMISGVIMNRIKEGMRLQIDATVLYALGYHKSLVTLEDLKINSPYNTYLINGLPPGPICTPSFQSLEAALAPNTHSYFFYVVEAYGNPQHIFAKTYEEHLSNVEKYKQSKRK